MFERELAMSDSWTGGSFESDPFNESADISRKKENHMGLEFRNSKLTLQWNKQQLLFRAI